MKLRRSLLAPAVPVAIALTCATTASAAPPKVSFRVEAAKRTLLAPTTVTAPSTGSITKGGTPTGSCPADSAAGALGTATHGNWDGTYSSGLGIEVTSILGTTAQYSSGSYWEFFVNDREASTGVCDTSLKAGEQLLFAQVPSKGRAELPLVVTAPTTVKAGAAFTLRSFVYPGRGSATKPVKVVPKVTGHGPVRVARETTGSTRLTLTRPGSYTISASATGEIRSAPVTIRVTR